MSPPEKISSSRKNSSFRKGQASIELLLVLAAVFVLGAALFAYYDGQERLRATQAQDAVLRDAAGMLAGNINDLVVGQESNREIFLPDGNYEIGVENRRVSANQLGGTGEYTAPLLSDLVTVRGTLEPGISVRLTKQGSTIIVTGSNA